MQCTKPVFIQVKYKSGRPSFSHPDGLTVPCGKCLACRISKRREWALRLQHEKEMHDDSIFLTLTYSDDNLPANLSLRKRDLQLFYKRLRKILPHNKKIRYFACGEYGDRTNRPHYHSIIFGLSLRPDDKYLVKQAWPFCNWSIPSISRRSFGLVEPDSINYVAQYIDKKFSGDLAKEEYFDKNREPVFRLSSLGIGRDYCDHNRDTLIDNQCINYRGSETSLPRYYIKRLGLTTDLLRSKAIEKDCEVVEHHSGIHVNSDVLYRYGEADDVRSYLEGLKRAKEQHDLNLHARMNLRNSKL